ncbi:ATP-dependent DNA ligase [Acidisarcina polymorpha]|uniref:DNA ligase (ATP) n=1 Tax=Acidisarcina polymorpha TaxID=2211140 RepID=A0A2Z5FZ62_9BACT|nr:ATP-dependent DNA ligase [Acidisarcina polymorpha]AXC11824.1 ATP-dependent DNA ligase [Acidisarcina polymorpha]
MQLPVNPPILPMLAKRIDQIPSGDAWIFEPKWDGFRALIFRDGDEVLIQSRDGKSLNRYFPELLAPIRSQLPAQCVFDGEIVIAGADGLDFDALQLRIHPAASRVKLLASQIPASIVFFDLLAVGDQDLRGESFRNRRERMISLLAAATPPIHVTPATSDKEVASDWFRRFEGAGLDGVVAKSSALGYEPNKRVMLKIKHERDCDCVVAGFRWYKQGEHTAVGSLLLGLFDDSGMLQHVGVCASFTQEKRKELVALLAPYRENALTGHPWQREGANEAASGDGERRMPGGQSRWSQGKDLSWEPLRPELVVEVAYEHMQGSRFRHMAQFRRWRVDKTPSECTYAQLEVVPPQELMSIFPGNR